MVHASNALYSADYALWEQAAALRSDAVERDIASNNAYWARYDQPVAEVSNRVNDAYLKANGQENGVQSYGRMVDLLLAYYREKAQEEPAPPAVVRRTAFFSSAGGAGSSAAISRL